MKYHQQKERSTMNQNLFPNLTFSVMAFVLIGTAILSFDYLLSRNITNATGVVVESRPISFGPGETPYQLIFVRDNQVFTSRIPEILYREIEPRDRVLITRRIGPLTGIVYHQYLYDHGRLLPITQAKELPYDVQ